MEMRERNVKHLKDPHREFIKRKSHMEVCKKEGIKVKKKKKSDVDPSRLSDMLFTVLQWHLL